MRRCVPSRVRALTRRSAVSVGGGDGARFLRGTHGLRRNCSELVVSSLTSDALTGIFGLGNDFGEQFSKVGQVFSQEFGFEDERLSGVICQQLTSKKLRFPCNPQSRAPFGVLRQE